MAITGINNSSYTSYYASNYKNTVKKTDSEKDSTNTKDGNVTTSTVELKTSRPGVTKTEQIKTGYSNVNDYSKYLQGKYHYMNIGLTSMQGIPTTVSVSSAFLQKCMNDPEKAKYLEENLAAIPDCTKDTINGCLGTVTNQSYMIDANGNIIETASGTNDPDGKIAKENAERKAKENREKEEKVKEKRAAKKAEEEKPETTETDEKDKVEDDIQMPEDKSPFGTYLLIALVAVGAAAGGYYFKVYKPKHEYDDEDEMEEDEDESEDSESEKREVDDADEQEESTEPEILRDEDFDDNVLEDEEEEQE